MWIFHLISVTIFIQNQVPDLEEMVMHSLGPAADIEDGFLFLRQHEKPVPSALLMHAPKSVSTPIRSACCLGSAPFGRTSLYTDHDGNPAGLAL